MKITLNNNRIIGKNYEPYFIAELNTSHFGDLEKAKNILTDAVQSKDELRITVADGASKIPEYINKLISEGIEVSTVSASKPTLDDVFLEVTGNRLEGTEKAAEEKPTTTRKRRGR